MEKPSQPFFEPPPSAEVDASRKLATAALVGLFDRVRDASNRHEECGKEPRCG